ncbi:MAG: NADP-dependent oxidoreductase [Marinovum sp.]|nr:NADP-dependent oxidoreductase [Marinovum sp.]
MEKWVLASRPEGTPVLENFRLEEAATPEPQDGEIVVATDFLSLDPYMRGRMDDVKSYAPSVNLGDVMTGQGVGNVVASRDPKFKEGDLVTGMTGWATHAALSGAEVRHISPEVPPTTALGVLGMPGFTAWAAMHTIGEPKEGETFVTAAATGPVGSMAAQIAKRKGLRTIAVAGGANKCDLATNTFGFDAAFDHRAHDVKSLRGALADAAPNGVDIYFENVGGKVLHATLPLMNVAGRIPVIGTIAWYSGVDTSGPDMLPSVWRATLVKRLRIQGLIIFDHWHLFRQFIEEMAEPVARGEVAYVEDITQGLDQMPAAFLSLLSGGNTGKAIVAI